MGGKAVTWWAQSNPRTNSSLEETRAVGYRTAARNHATPVLRYATHAPVAKRITASQRSVPWRKPHQQSESVGSLTTAVVGLGGADQLVGKESRPQSMRLVAATEELVVP